MNKLEYLYRIHVNKSLAEINANVSSVKVNLSYNNNDEYLSKSKEQILSPESSVICFFDCINPTCTKGYIDFTNKLRDMLSRNEENFKQQEICDGYQDERRVNQNGCRVKIQYEIKILYKDNS